MNSNNLIGGKLVLKNNKVTQKTKMKIASSINITNNKHKRNQNPSTLNKLIMNESLEEIERQAFDIANTSTKEEKELMKDYLNQIEKDSSTNKEIEPSIELFNQMTPAERLFEEKRLKRLPEKIKKMTRTSFKEKYQTYYKSLTKLPEHHDIPKVGPG